MQPERHLHLARGDAPPPVVDATLDPLSIFLDRTKEANDITVTALEGLERGPEHFLRLPWEAAAKMVGPIEAGSFVVLAGRSGHGKTSFMMSWFDRIVASGFGAMYAGTEMPPKSLKIHWACRRLAARGVYVHPGDALTGKLHGQSPERVNGWAEKAEALRDELLAMRVLNNTARLVPVPYMNTRVITRLAEQAHAWGLRVIFLDHLDHVDGEDSSNSDTAEHNAVLKATHAAGRKYDVTFVGGAQLKQNAQPDIIRRFQPLSEDVVRFGMLKRQIADLMLCTYRPLPERPTSLDHLACYRKALNRLRDDEQGIERYLIPNTIGLGLMKDRNYGHDGAHCLLGIHGGRITDASQLDQIQAETMLYDLGR